MQNTLIDIGKDSQTYTGFAHLHVNDFVEQQTTESLYYSRAWLDLITKLYGYSMIPLIATNTTGQITGFLPLCSVQSPLTGRRLVALPFSDYCPLLATDDAITSNLIDQAIHLAQRQKVKYLELRTDLNNLWSQLKSSVRGKVRKSQKLGVQIRVAQHREDMAHYYRLHLHTRSKKHGMPAQPRRFFFGLWDAFAASGAMQLLLAEYQGSIIAGMILLASGTTVRYAYGASNDSYLSLAPNNLLMWEAIAWGCRQGYQTFDLGRTALDNEGLMEFKRRWGAIKEPLPYYYYPHVAGLAATSESSRKFQLLTACWRRLPLRITEPLGDHLYKHLG